MKKTFQPAGGSFVFRAVLESKNVRENVACANEDRWLKPADGKALRANEGCAIRLGHALKR